MDHKEPGTVKEQYPAKEISKNQGNPPSHHSANLIAIIDTRACIRDAIAQSLRDTLDSLVIAIESVKDLTGPAFDIEIDSGTMIIYCDGAITDQSNVDQDTSELRNTFATAKIVLLTDRLHQVSLNTFHQHVLNGIIPSSYNTEQLRACIFTILAGVPFLPPALLEQQVLLELPIGSKRKSAFKKLTPRQHQIMEYIHVGKSNKFIAAELSLCESTVKVHVHEVMKRLGATSRTHASYILANDIGPE